MPFYEYKCARCGHALEALQKLSDPPLRKCPDCGKSALKKLISPPVFRLKGSGWYETDFKSEKEGKRNIADAPEREPKADDKKDVDKKDDKKKEETKPEAKSETKSETATAPVASASGSEKPKKASTHARKRAARKPK